MKNLYQISDINKPHNFNQLFSEQKPLVLDIGAGKGEFVVAMSQKFPQYNYLSIEKKVPRAELVAKRAKEKQMNNIAVLQARIEHLFPHCFFHNCVHEAYMNFPDPWQKTRQTKRRSLNSDFVDHISKVLIDDGIFHFATDVKDYAEGTLELLENRKDFKNLNPKKWFVNEIEEHRKTLFYHHARNIGENCYFLKFGKVS